MNNDSQPTALRPLRHAQDGQAQCERKPKTVRAELVEALARYLERGGMALIGAGLVMLMQPWAIEVYSYAFTVLLAGVIGYSIAGKLPELTPTPEAPSAPPPQGGATSGPAKPVPRWPAKEPGRPEPGA